MSGGYFHFVALVFYFLFLLLFFLLFSSFFSSLPPADVDCCEAKHRVHRERCRICLRGLRQWQSDSNYAYVMTRRQGGNVLQYPAHGRLSLIPRCIRRHAQLFSPPRSGGETARSHIPWRLLCATYEGGHKPWQSSVIHSFGAIFLCLFDGVSSFRDADMTLE